MVETKITNWDRVYETEDSFGEYQTFKKKEFYLFGIKVWSYKFDFEDRPITEWISKRVG